MDRFFSKLDLRDIKIEPNASFPPDDAACEVEETNGFVDVEADVAPVLLDLAPQKPKDHLMVVNLSGRGDKDLASVEAYLESKAK